MNQIGASGEKVNFKEQEKEITEIISNPFSQEKITGIHLHYSKVKSYVKEGFETYISGTVVFENGNTKGEQKIVADSFPELIKLVFEFCNNI